MPEYKRTCNKDFFFSRLHMKGLTVEALALLLHPPLQRTAINRLVSPGDPYKTEKRIKEVAEILGEQDVLLFPFAPVEAQHPAREE